MRILYVSDLDGTLLRSDEHTSAYTNRVINELTARGMLFSYATARSHITARKVTEGLAAKIPLIVYNGASIRDNVSGAVLHMNGFGSGAAEVFDSLMAAGVCPIVYAFVDGAERFSYWPERCSRAMLDFLATRRGDVRAREVHSAEELARGDRFYFTCIGEEQKLIPLNERWQHTHRCIFSRDIYSGEQWLEIMPRGASKANAAAQLKRMLNCDRLIVFGDGVNDLDMFDAADECYAVANAHPALKARATAVIGSNDEDGVARWLEMHVQP